MSSRRSRFARTARSSASDEHVLEEAVEQRPELGGRLDRRAEVARIECCRDLRVDALERLGHLDLGLLDEQSRIELGRGASLLLREPARAVYAV